MTETAIERKTADQHRDEVLAHMPEWIRVEVTEDEKRCNNHWRYGRMQHVTRPAELRFAVDRYGHNGRLVISGECMIADPDSKNHYTAQSLYLKAVTTQITVSPAKSGQQIAKDIERRLLPDLCKIIEAARERATNTIEYNDAFDANARTVAEAFGGTYGPHNYKNEKCISFPRQLPISQKYLSGDDAELEIRLTGAEWAEVAPAILAVLKNRPKETED